MALSFRQIEVFRCLMSAGTTTRAAAKLSISQPGVSRHIAELEGHLGFKLFDRIKGRLAPTTAAVQFARVVEQNFLGLERIEQAGANIRDNVPQPVVIACLPALSTSLMPRVAQHIRRSNQTWSLVVDTGTVAEIIENLQNHSADLALTLEIPEILGIEAEPLFTVDHVCALPADHRLAAKEVITPEDFREETVVGWSSAGPLGFEKEAEIFAGIVNAKDIRFTTHTSHSRYALVAAGLGITIAEPFAAGPWLKNGVAVRRFEPSLPLSYSLCFPTGRIRSEGVGAVRAAILASVKAWRQESDAPFGLREVKQATARSKPKSRRS
ncbi:MAG: LysR substrate-binding domain-containing protein [Pseudomonadota bacterium]